MIQPRNLICILFKLEVLTILNGLDIAERVCVG